MRNVWLERQIKTSATDTRETQGPRVGKETYTSNRETRDEERQTEASTSSNAEGEMG